MDRGSDDVQCRELPGLHQATQVRLLCAPRVVPRAYANTPMAGAGADAGRDGGPMYCPLISVTVSDGPDFSARLHMVSGGGARLLATPPTPALPHAHARPFLRVQVSYLEESRWQNFAVCRGCARAWCPLATHRPPHRAGRRFVVEPFRLVTITDPDEPAIPPCDVR